MKYYYAVHHNEHANPAESDELIAFDKKLNRDEFIRLADWPYEPIDNPEDIVVRFWEDCERDIFEQEIEDAGNPSFALWVFRPKSTESDIEFPGSLVETFKRIQALTT